MKALARRFVIVAVALVLVSSVYASTLESKKNEWAFDFSFADNSSDDPAIADEKDTNLDGAWSWVFGKGHHQIGALVSYLNVDSDDPTQDFDGVAVGPLYTFNWTPGKEKATGFVEAAYSTTSGDLGDGFDSIIHLGVGARVFAGDTAAIRIVYFFDQLAGATGFADADSTGLAAGISFFTHRK